MSKTADEKKLLQGLGLCVRAGRVIFGVPMICEAMRRGGASAPVSVWEAGDTSENTHKKISDKCAYYKVKQIRLSVDGAALAASLGKTGSLGAVAVTDRALSEMVEKNLTAEA
jgi:ribosomal protein L7Ae-like RNA K-turn-binding protein